MKVQMLINSTILIFGSFLLSAQSNQDMPPIDYPYSLHHQKINDSISIAFAEEGEGADCLLFIHGLGSNLKAWQKAIDYFSNDFRCVAVNLPGYYEAEAKDHSYDMVFFSESIRILIDSLGLESAHVVGHSMGGQIAVHLALENPEMVKSLTLLAPAGFEVFSDAEKQWFQTFYTSAFIKSATEEQIVKNFELNFVDMPDDARFMIEDRLKLRASKSYDAYCEMIPKCVLGMLNQPVFDRLSDLDLPGLIMYGDSDQLIPNRILHPTLNTEGVAQKGHAEFKGSHLKIIPKAGHFLQWENADLVHAEMTHFLNWVAQHK